jgi:ABC-type Fe3+/spermidine/putrescine transport system ATPase subunit
MADRIAVMNRGTIEQCGTPSDIYDKPATLFVADFVGQMNRFEGLLETSDQKRCSVRVKGVDQAFTAQGGFDLHPRKKVVATVRPERIRFHVERDTKIMAENIISAKIVEVIFTGEKFTAYLETPVGMIVAVSQNRSSTEVDSIIAGNKIRVYWSPDDMSIFPA